MESKRDHVRGLARRRRRGRRGRGAMEHLMAELAQTAPLRCNHKDCEKYNHVKLHEEIILMPVALHSEQAVSDSAEYSTAIIFISISDGIGRETYIESHTHTNTLLAL